ncbi:hypothetical protein V1511DRAFT_460788 [Dipodascopsis uninucleata]
MLSDRLHSLSQQHAQSSVIKGIETSSHINDISHYGRSTSPVGPNETNLRTIRVTTVGNYGLQHILQPQSSDSSDVKDAPLISSKSHDGKPRRAYKACINCRVRKAKCIFPEAMHMKPPCLRCQREGRDCQFLPSRRGGRRNIEKGRALKEQAAMALQQASAEVTMANKVLQTVRQNTATKPTNVPSRPPKSEMKEPKDENPRVDTETLAFSFLRNPADAINILARASSFSGDEEEPDSGGGRASSCSSDVSVLPGHEQHTMSRQKEKREHDQDDDSNERGSKKNRNSIIYLRYQEKIQDFYLVRAGYINPAQLRTCVSIFFSRHHHYLPLVPASKIPVSDELLGEFAQSEPFLLTAMIVVASRFENRAIHDICWKYMQSLISDLTFGTEPTVGAVEALLLLSENIPHLPTVEHSKLHNHEERIMWNLIGLAIRISYYLGLDQKTLIDINESMNDQTHRERLAWTYCYMHDRQASIRLGKGFWSRGPGLCFQNPDVTTSIVLDSSVNFPTMARSSGNSEDYSSHIQAQIELTQILTNIHDTLYPSRDRTITLVNVGEYYRILDELTRSFTAFRIAWQSKSWETFPMNEVIWITYHYARLYAYGFAFQSHLRRRTARYREAQNVPAEDRPSLANIIFPRGLAGSPDAKFIIESQNSAVELLEICVDHLHAGGALAYLPSRYYGYISYAVVFLIKVVFTGAILAHEQQKILELVRRVINAFSDLGSAVDKQHPLVRRTGQLRTLVKTLWTAEGMSIASTPVPTHMSSSNASGMNGLGSDNVSGHGEVLGSNGGNASNSNQQIGNDLFSFDFASGSETSEGGADLTSLLSFDIDSEIWLSYFYNNEEMGGVNDPAVYDIK